MLDTYGAKSENHFLARGIQLILVRRKTSKGFGTRISERRIPAAPKCFTQKTPAEL